MLTVRFPLQGLSAVVPEGTALVEAARAAGIRVESPCGGGGRCGKCKMKVSAEHLDNLTVTAVGPLSEDERRAGFVLACHALVKRNLEAEFVGEGPASTNILSSGKQVDTNLDSPICKIFLEDENITRVHFDGLPKVEEPGDSTGRCYGAAIDIGTTTLVAALIDLNTGKELGATSSLNPQVVFGHDVLSRIRCAADPEGFVKLHDAIVRELERMLSMLARRGRIETAHIYELVLSGNTCMLHLAAGVNPLSLGRYPYTPMLKGGECIPVRDVGFSLPDAARIYFPPIISGFVGADITAGIIATGLHREPGVVLFIDIGTNGEMVLSINGRLVATSTAAGPAFEGMNIACGMRAADGAVEKFSIGDDGLLSVGTIGKAKPVGICGSGLVDVVGELVSHGVLDRNGRFSKNGHIPDPIRERMSFEHGKSIFLISDEVFLTQQDVRQVQLAKGALRSGIDILLAGSGLKYSDVDQVLIAGAFGFHLRTKNLVRIGILPGELEAKIDLVGNTSKTGARALLLDLSLRREALRIVDRVNVIELANEPGFERTFIGNLAF
jgi:uncharacterized 2Fe-2S/4Fe-4S cluster protein (DUF4445 family)